MLVLITDKWPWAITVSWERVDDKHRGQTRFMMSNDDITEIYLEYILRNILLSHVIVAFFCVNS